MWRRGESNEYYCVVLGVYLLRVCEAVLGLHRTRAVVEGGVADSSLLFPGDRGSLGALPSSWHTIHTTSI